ncbi:hypothetical protein [Cyanobacterium sp. uoEpiScrs1]|uniref:hypothetical protein n=1 Tax=Cyanobacterium sp. uoEpiScrs1 TaxID=2976343 RepID=UPI00226A1EB7|nr:hypothetical protein [Cyanobacterium sp. uoEpiScrs1]
MKQTTIKQQQVTYSNLPLAVYRELAAHLQQVKGVTTELIPQQLKQFDYTQSQVKTLIIHYTSSLDTLKKYQIQMILDYYAKIYGKYELR